jgi:hypothetical protein
MLIQTNGKTKIQTAKRTIMNISERSGTAGNASMTPSAAGTPAPSNKPDETDPALPHKKETDSDVPPHAPHQEPEHDPTTGREREQEDVRPDADAQGTKETLGVP